MSARRSRRFKWFCRWMALRVGLAAIAPAFFVQPAHAYGASSYVSDAMTDLTFPNFEEGLIQWKALQTGVSTASESSAMTAALDVGFGSLVESAEASAIGLAAVGTPVGWLALLGIAGGAGAYCIVQGCTSPLWSAEGTSPVTFGEPVPMGANITAGQPLWQVTGGTNQSKTQNCYGSDPDEAIAECVSWMNTNDTTTQYLASAANASNTATLTEYNKTTNKPNGQTVSMTAANNQNAPYSCSAPSALTVASAGCTFASGDATPGNPVLPLLIGDPVTEAQKIPLQYGKASLSPDVLADVANQAWRLAAAQQGYKGLPYSSGSPITTADVQSYASTLPASAYPTVQSATAPIPQINPAGSTSPDTPITQPSSSPTSAPQVDLPPVTSPGGTTQTGTTTPPSSSTTTSTGTTGSTTTTTTSTGTSNTTNVTVNTCGLLGQPACEVDWNSTGATQTTPTAPEYSDVFKLLLTFSNLSFWKNWTVSVPAGTCTVFQVPYSGTNYPLDVCTPLASMQALFQSVETALIAMTTVFILLGA